jgi:hypothetical protein
MAGLDDAASELESIARYLRRAWPAGWRRARRHGLISEQEMS